MGKEHTSRATKLPREALHSSKGKSRRRSPGGGERHDLQDTGQEHLTDSGNAKRLVMRHGQDVRHCGPWGKWLVWAETHWRLDDTAEIVRRAKDTIAAMFDGAVSQAGDAGARLKDASRDEGEGNLKRQVEKAQTLMTHCLRSESAPRIRAMIDLARSEPGIPILPGEMDRDPWALNCSNGVLDLHKGKLRSHARQDLITKTCHTEYLPGAPCPIWEQFVFGILQAPALIRYVQKLFGYSLTGDVSEQILPIFWGTGANGKSTLINAIMAMMGEDYAVKASRDLFMSRKQDNHPAQLARLFGKRLVVCVESHEGARLDEGLVKELTGGDPITARRMREDPWQFDPTHKAILITNHKPEIRGTDEGIWRRQRLIPFTVRIPDDRQDKELAVKLRAEAPGILAWCVKGCLLWQREGLEAPDEVKAATSAYRSEQDVLAAFVDERCIVSREVTGKASELYAGYQKWCESGGEDPVNQRKFGMALSERGFDRERTTGGLRTWKGISLRE